MDHTVPGTYPVCAATTRARMCKSSTTPSRRRAHKTPTNLRRHTWLTAVQTQTSGKSPRARTVRQKARWSDGAIV